MNNRFVARVAFIVLGIFLAIDIVFLNIKAFSTREQLPKFSPIAAPTLTYPEEVVLNSKGDGCPASCLLAIDEATKQAEKKSPLPTKPAVNVVGVKEIYIPFGSGSTKSLDWVELAGVESVIDSADYPNTKSMIFEASLKVPTANGRVYAKIFNVTDKHDVWGSEVSSEGPTSYRAESANITLSPGRKLYRVMMKSTMGYEAILDWARIKINFE